MVHVKIPLLVLGIFYVQILLLCVFQIARIVYFKHNRRTYHFSFLLLCMAWSLIRAVYFIIEGFDQWRENWLSLTIFWLPIIIQFATFALLVMYYASLVHRESFSDMYWWISFAMYLLSNAVFLAIMIGYFIVTIVYEEPHWADSVMQGYTGVVFLVLVVLLAIYGLRLHLMIFRGILPTPFHLKGRYSNMRVLVTTAIIVLIYAGRSIYDFITVADIGSITIDDDNWLDELLVMFLYAVWEILPVSLVLFLFWRIPRTTLGVLKGTPRFPSMPHSTKDARDDEDITEEFTPLKSRSSQTFMPYSPTPVYSTSASPTSYATRSREPSVNAEA